MTFSKDLEYRCVIPDQINEKNNMPLHAIKVPIDKIVNQKYSFYCCDSRKNECEYHKVFEGRSYCTYSKD